MTTDTLTPALTAEAFLAHMAAMQTHYSPGGAGMLTPGAKYPLPTPIMELAKSTPLRAPALTAIHAASVRAAPPPPPAPLQAISRVLQQVQQDTLAFVQNHHDSVTKALPKPGTATATAAFVQQMQALEQKEIADHAARIDAMFRGLIAAGQAHAGHQAQILQATNHTGSFLVTLLHGAHEVLHGITASVAAAGHAVGNAVHAAADAVGHWAAGAAKSVGSFFKSLF